MYADQQSIAVDHLHHRFFDVPKKPFENENINKNKDIFFFGMEIEPFYLVVN